MVDGKTLYTHMSDVKLFPESEYVDRGLGTAYRLRFIHNMYSLCQNRF